MGRAKNCHIYANKQKMNIGSVESICNEKKMIYDSFPVEKLIFM